MHSVTYVSNSDYILQNHYIEHMFPKQVIVIKLLLSMNFLRHMRLYEYLIHGAIADGNPIRPAESETQKRYRSGKSHMHRC